MMVRCAECGLLFGDLGCHIRKHKMTAAEYQAKHGVNPRWRANAPRTSDQEQRLYQYMQARGYIPKGRYGKR